MNRFLASFKLKENGTTVRTEITAGITIFFATVYTVIVVPGMVSFGDQQVANGVFFASCIAAAFGTLLMAFVARLPFAQAPGMGLSAFFAFTAMPALLALSGDPNLPVVKQYQMALTLVLVSGTLFVLVSVFGIREMIINGIPRNIKLALASGIGLFITLLGLKNAGIVVGSPATFVTLVNFGDFTGNGTAVLGASLSLFGVFVIAVLFAKKVKGSVLIGIVATAVLAYVLGHSRMPESFAFNLGERTRDFMAVSFFRLDFAALFAGGNTGAVLGSLLALILAFALVNMFDSLGTIFGVASAAGMVNQKGEVVGLKKGLMCDAIGSATAGLLGSATTATLVESSAGIGEGGRTGLTSLVTGILFILALFLAPFVALIPDVATAPALIFVGCLMMSGIKEVDFKDPTEALPAFLTIAMMPLTFSIANGIAFGLVSFIVLKLFTGRAKEIKLAAVIVAALFVLQYILG